MKKPIAMPPAQQPAAQTTHTHTHTSNPLPLAAEGWKDVFIDANDFGDSYAFWERVSEKGGSSTYSHFGAGVRKKGGSRSLHAIRLVLHLKSWRAERGPVADLWPGGPARQRFL